jgi:hypothetical protein
VLAPSRQKKTKKKKCRPLVMMVVYLLLFFFDDEMQRTRYALYTLKREREGGEDEICFLTLSLSSKKIK